MTGGAHVPLGHGHMTWLDVDSWKDTDPPRVPWVVENFCAQGMVTVLVGEPGIGKSMIALNAAACAAVGVPFIDMHTKPRETVIIDAENGPNEMHRRMKALKFFDNVTVADVANFDFYDQLYLLEAACEGASKGILILDSLRTIWGGDENDSKAVTRALTALQQMARNANVAVIVIHHTNKIGAFRGSGAIQAVPEIMVTAGRLQRDKLGTRFYMKWEKLRSAPRPSTKWGILENGIVLPSHRPTADELWPKRDD